ncbi:MAG: hypothetical protein WCI18_11490 [Pseudomonadota bacterium]
MEHEPPATAIPQFQEYPFEMGSLDDLEGSTTIRIGYRLAVPAELFKNSS